jgi:hypothetical protein
MLHPVLFDDCCLLIYVRGIDCLLFLLGQSMYSQNNLFSERNVVQKGREQHLMVADQFIFEDT